MQSDSMISIVTEGSDDTAGAESSPPPIVAPPALHTLILSDCRIGNAAIEQVCPDKKHFTLLQLM